MDYQRARDLLEKTFREVEHDISRAGMPKVGEDVADACARLFSSSTKAYREALLGCMLARVLDESIDISLPYVGQSARAFNGRTLDEKAVNPFLHDKQVPCTRGPYLSVFRRNVRFDTTTRNGLRDQAGYDAFLAVVEHAKSLSTRGSAQKLLRFLLYKFAEVREASRVPLSRIQRMSLEQYDAVVARLLDTPSGGVFPLLLVVAMFNTIRRCFSLDWRVQWQRINVSDAASGASGDVTILAGDRVVLAAEVTERPVEASRVAAIFRTKIAPAGVEDYLFFVRLSALPEDAREQARKYFTQGHEINFLEITHWIHALLATFGSEGRSVFNGLLLDLLNEPEVPATLKVAWNAALEEIIGAAS